MSSLMMVVTSNSSQDDRLQVEKYTYPCNGKFLNTSYQKIYTNPEQRQLKMQVKKHQSANYALMFFEIQNLLGMAIANQLEIIYPIIITRSYLHALTRINMSLLETFLDSAFEALSNAAFVYMATICLRLRSLAQLYATAIITVSNGLSAFLGSGSPGSGTAKYSHRIRFRVTSIFKYP